VSGCRQVLIALFLVSIAGCRQSDSAPKGSPAAATLNVGFGLTTGDSSEAGLQQAVRNIVLERLVNFSKDGRPQPNLIDQWSSSPDRLTWRLHVRSGVVFHDGTPLTSEAIRDTLIEQLPAYLGPAYADVREINVVNEGTLEVQLRQPTSFLVEGLEVPVERPGTWPIGTGPFSVVGKRDDVLELRRNDTYHLGAPIVETIRLRPYKSVRAAWAELLRGQVDMLYEVGLDALDSLQPSNETRIFTYQRDYAYLILFNVQRPALRSMEFRRMLNAAIDRQTLVAETLKGHGSPAEGPVSPAHWAFTSDLPRFGYSPDQSKASRGGQFTCLVAESSLEQLALATQKQLQAVGVEMRLEMVSMDDLFLRIKAGNFDAILADAVSGPFMLRLYRSWHTGSPNNWGHYSSATVDAALDSIRSAADDAAYKTGVAAFQRAIVADPPAIFLAWSERARAVSTRFDVPVEPGRDILSTLRLWRPVTGPRARSTN
jgi:peptide/nickel transport system substrate-binding protein